MTSDWLAKERAERPMLSYTVTFTEGEYVAICRAVLAADVHGEHGVHLGVKDALVNARVGRGVWSVADEDQR